MKNISLSVSAVTLGILVTVNGFADEDSQTGKEVAKETAVKVCMARAIEVYGSATTNVKPRKSRIGRNHGYLVQLKVGKGRKRVRCMTDEDSGETKFYISISAG